MIHKVIIKLQRQRDQHQVLLKINECNSKNCDCPSPASGVDSRRKLTTRTIPRGAHVTRNFTDQQNTSRASRIKRKEGICGCETEPTFYVMASILLFSNVHVMQYDTGQDIHAWCSKLYIYQRKCNYDDSIIRTQLILSAHTKTNNFEWTVWWIGRYLVSDRFINAFFDQTCSKH